MTRSSVSPTEMGRASVFGDQQARDADPQREPVQLGIKRIDHRRADLALVPPEAQAVGGDLRQTSGVDPHAAGAADAPARTEAEDEIGERAQESLVLRLALAQHALREARAELEQVETRWAIQREIQLPPAAAWPATTPLVRPWKLSAQTMISAFPSGTPLTS